MQQAGAMSPPALPPSGFQQRVSDTITAFCGDLRFVYLHTVLFAAWIATRGFGHDKFPFNFLTMTVSLEAIFLSTFILISQNRQQAMADAQNKMVQEALLQMLRDMVGDEKIDLKNEQLISPTSQPDRRGSTSSRSPKRWLRSQMPSRASKRRLAGWRRASTRGEVDRRATCCSPLWFFVFQGFDSFSARGNGEHEGEAGIGPPPAGNEV